jgi:hypothetical protein
MSIYWARTKREARSGACVRHASATKTATMEAAASEVSPAAVTASSAAARIRPRGQTEGKQTEADNAKYSFCFHVLSSRQPLVTAIARPRDFKILPKTY